MSAAVTISMSLWKPMSLIRPATSRSAPGGSTISAKVFRYATSVQFGATTNMIPGAGVEYTATVTVDDAEIPIGEWMYSVAEANWVVDVSDSETTQPKKAPA